MSKVDMVDISIIIANWNSKDYLYNCIKSIMNSRSTLKKEIIVVDNASSDGSVELVKRDFPDVKIIINEQNCGFSKANNIGIKISKGKYLFIVNPDIILFNDCIDTLYDYMENNPTVGLLGPKILGDNGCTQRSYMAFPTLWNTFCRSMALDKIFPNSRLFCGLLMTYKKFEISSEVDVINGCFWVVRREAINFVGLLDERFFIYAEDIDWCKRFHDDNWGVIYFPHAEVIHFGGGSSSNAPTRFYIEMQKANLKYWEKHYGRLQYLGYYFNSLAYQVIRISFFGMIYIFTFKNRIKEKILKHYKCLIWLMHLRPGTEKEY